MSEHVADVGAASLIGLDEFGGHVADDAEEAGIARTFRDLSRHQTGDRGPAEIRTCLHDDVSPRELRRSHVMDTLERESRPRRQRGDHGGVLGREAHRGDGFVKQRVDEDQVGGTGVLDHDQGLPSSACPH